MTGRARAQKIIFTRRLKQRIARLHFRVQLLIKQAFAQAADRDHHLAGLAAPNDLLQHHRAIGERGTALRRYGAHGDQGFRIDALDQRGEIGGVARRNDIAMHHFERVIALAHVQFGERAPGAADRVKCPAAQFFQRRRLGQLLFGDALGVLDRTAGGIHQRQRAEFQRHALADPALARVDQFQRAAAEIADHAIGVMTGRDHAHCGELRLAHAGNQLDRAADRHLRRGEKLRAIGGVARRRRRDGAHILDLHEFAEYFEPAQGFERPRHALFRKTAGRRHALAEAA